MFRMRDLPHVIVTLPPPVPSRRHRKPRPTLEVTVRCAALAVRFAQSLLAATETEPGTVVTVWARGNAAEPLWQATKERPPHEGAAS